MSDKKKYEVIIWCDDKQWLVEATDKGYIPVGMVDRIVEIMAKREIKITKTI